MAFMSTDADHPQTGGRTDQPRPEARLMAPDGRQRLRPAARVRLAAATWAGRAAAVASRLAGRGSGASIRGTVMLKLDPRALSKLLAGKRIAMVSGTNGKTTTTHFLAAAVRASLADGGIGPRGDRLVHNADGANLHHGIASALSEHPEAEIAILETDERVVADMIRLGRPEVLVLLNFSRDQLDRHHEIKGLGRSWRDALTAAGADGPVVVANADEPLIVWAAQTAREVVWVDTATTWTQDASLCPNCGSQPGPRPARPHRRLGRATGTAPDATWPSPRPTTGWSTARSSTAGSRCWDPELHVPGAFNVSNAACALAAAELMGVEPDARSSACGR